MPAVVGHLGAHVDAPLAENVEGRKVVLDEIVAPTGETRDVGAHVFQHFGHAGVERLIAAIFTGRPAGKRQLAGTRSDVSSGRIQMPGRTPRDFISAAKPGRSGKLRLPSCHGPPLLGRLQICQPSSITMNGRLSPSGAQLATLALSRTMVACELLL
jgi:hypothetical protein